MQTQLRRGLLASTILIGASLIATPAFAQENAAANEAEAGDKEIVVTGSLIANPNLERATPVLTTSAEEIELRQSNTAEQLLRELPGTVPSIGSAVNNGNGGASFVDLRGIGSNRNVVLLDGRRLVPADLVGRFDLNNVPLALIERVENLTGGASTTYGADAVAGVVNFITKQNFAGLDIQASNQITERGDGNIFRIDAVIGANFDDGRGNVTFAVGYQEADPVYQGDRAFSRFNISAFNGAISGSGTSVPSRFTGVNATGADFVAGVNTVQGNVQSTGTGFRPGLTFDPFNFNPYNIFQTPFERFNMYGAGSYELSDAVEVYTRGIYSKNTVKTIIAPSGAFGISVQVPLSNPFLTAAQRNAFCQFDTNSGVGYTPRFTPAQCAAAATATNPSDPNYREVTTVLSRRATEVGPRISDYRTQFFDYTIGARGNITSTVNWDVYGSYGESENLQTILNYTLNSRFRQGIRATNPNTCIDNSNGCVPINVFGPEGSITPAMVDFLTATSTVLTRASLAQAHATVSGDLGVALPWAEDAIGFAIGGEYRKYTASQQSDELARTGDLGGAGGAAPNIDGGYDIYEAIAEVLVPVVQDKPFFQDLTIGGGIRYSSYSVDAPNSPSYNTTTWKIEGSWSPVEDIKFRGSFSRAVRAPNINELFSPQNTGLLALTDDPCASVNDLGAVVRPAPTGTLRAVCLAQGASAASLGTIPQPTAGQANQTSGGNLNLDPEVSDSWTVGAVFRPTFLPGFTASIDYWNIKVEDAITNPTVGDAIAACFGNAGAGSPPAYSPAAGAESSEACLAIQRNPITGGLAGDPATTKGIFLALSNLGRIETSGLDVSMTYSTDLGFARLSANFAGTYVFTNKFNANVLAPDSVNRECVGFISVSCGSLQPEFFWNQRTTLSFDNVDVSLLWRHISSFQQEPDDINGAAFIGAVPSNASPLLGAPALGSLGKRNFRRIPAYDYFDLSTRVDVSENVSLTLTVANMFDKKAPLTGQDIGTTAFNSGNTFPSTFDALGRSYRVALRLKY